MLVHWQFQPHGWSRPVRTAGNDFSGATQLTVSQMLGTSSSFSGAGEKRIRPRPQSEGYRSLIALHDSRMKKEHRHIGAPLFMQAIELAALRCYFSSRAKKSSVARYARIQLFHRRNP